MISEQMQKRFVPDEIAAAVNRIRVPLGFRLWHKMKPPPHFACCLMVRSFIAGPDHDADFFNADAQDLVNQNIQD
jgi:hypothetical protein